jgi:hypothetical protein
MPKHPSSLEARKKKVYLERELEEIDARIDECRNKLRKHDALNVK